MNLTITHTIDLPRYGEQDCRITFKYSPGRSGSWYKRNGDPGDPPEPAEVEIIKVAFNGIDVTDAAEDILMNSDNFFDAAGEAYEAAITPEEI